MKVEAALDAAETEQDLRRAREVVLTQVIDLAVARRRMVTAVQHDPVIVRILAEHEPFRQLMGRLYRGADRWRHRPRSAGSGGRGRRRRSAVR